MLRVKTKQQTVDNSDRPCHAREVEEGRNNTPRPESRLYLGEFREKVEPEMAAKKLLIK